MFCGGGKALGNDIPGGEPGGIEAQQGVVKEQVAPVACGELGRVAGDGIEYSAVDLRVYPVSAEIDGGIALTVSQTFYSL